ncbi:MAG: hypothetical protein HYT64_01430 [Candidatus Yanofskybacteria bacterium]|nr:hypothetical protein [Candidatus Yanofskybacteria bacterium]
MFQVRALVGAHNKNKNMNQFERRTNRLVEDKKFCDGIYALIFEKLEFLSRTFDEQMVEMGYGTLAERIVKIKAGEKLGAEPEIKKIVLDIAWKRGLSDIERGYLLNSIFKPSLYRKTDNDD